MTNKVFTRNTSIIGLSTLSTHSELSGWNNKLSVKYKPERSEAL